MPADMSLLRPVSHRQLVLLELPRDIVAGLCRGFPPPPDPALEAALHEFTREHGKRHGWKKNKTDIIHRGIRIMLGIQDTPGAPIRRSDVALLSRIKHSAAVVAEVLEAAGMLEEDRVPAIERWFPIQIADLPEPMRHELTVWFDVMRNGSATPPRRLPRDDTTTNTQLRYALAALRQWVPTHASLREIGRDDVLAALPPSGGPRAITVQALRSIFTVLKGRRLVFVNPAARISVPKPNAPVPPPVDLSALREALNSVDPTKALLTALLAFHAVRLWQLTELRLTDIHDGRLHVAGQVVLLAEPVRDRLDAYLRFRNSTWPDSPNPYLFLHVRNAGTLRHVSPQWIRDQLPMAGQRIRQDRILDEATATGGDVRALCDLFGMSITTACRYATVLDRIDFPDRDTQPSNRP